MKVLLFIVTGDNKLKYIYITSFTVAESKALKITN